MKSGATLKEIAANYGVSVTTLRKWLKPIKKKIYPNGKTTHSHTPKQLIEIKNHLG